MLLIDFACSECTIQKVLLFIFVACTRRHLGHIIETLIVATLAHAAVLTAQTASTTSHIAAAAFDIEAITALVAAITDYFYAMIAHVHPLEPIATAQKNTKLFFTSNQQCVGEMPKITQRKIDPVRHTALERPNYLHYRSGEVKFFQDVCSGFDC